MKTICRIIMVASMVLGASLSNAQGQQPTQPVAAQAGANPAIVAVVQNLKRLYPSTTFKEISSTPLPGVYQVVMGKNVAYVEETGRYFIFGHLYDMREQKDLTPQVANDQGEGRQIEFASLPLLDAIKTVRGKGTRKLAVFSDPDCPYCKRLEASLEKIEDVTIYTFLYPLEGLHPDAKRKSIAVWCSKNPSASWSAMMLKNEVPDAKCDNHPIERIAKYAQDNGINGTPTLIFESGKSLPGAAPAERIEALLGEKR